MPVIPLTERLSFKDGFWMTFEDFTADADVTSTYDLLGDEHSDGIVPNTWALQIKRTAGSTAAISVKLQGSIDGNAYFTMMEAVLKDSRYSTVIDGSTSGYLPYPIRYMKITCVTVGAGNTLNATLMGMKS